MNVFKILFLFLSVSISATSVAVAPEPIIEVSSSYHNRGEYISVRIKNYRGKDEIQGKIFKKDHPELVAHLRQITTEVRDHENEYALRYNKFPEWGYKVCDAVIAQFKLDHSTAKLKRLAGGLFDSTVETFRVKLSRDTEYFLLSQSLPSDWKKSCRTYRNLPSI